MGSSPGISRPMASWVKGKDGKVYATQSQADQANAAYDNAIMAQSQGAGKGADGSYVPMTMRAGDHAASETTAAITRAKYDDWKNTFFPKIDELMGMTTYMNKGLVGEEIANAQQLTGQTFDNVAQGQQRNLSRFGMTQTAEQQAAQDDALTLGMSTAMVDAANKTRLMLKDRDRQIATGGLGGA